MGSVAGGLWNPERPDSHHTTEIGKCQFLAIVGGIEGQLPHQAIEPSRNRKRLRPNQLAEWELRIGDFRVFYDVDMEETLVKIEAIGYKEGNRLFVHGEEYEV